MTALMDGLVSLLACGIVIRAMKFGAMGVVSALRETGAIYAAIIGRLFLNEKLMVRRNGSRRTVGFLPVDVTKTFSHAYRDRA